MGDTSLITGANRGIGLEMTRALLAAGHHVIATCRDPDGASELAALSGDGSLEMLPLDVTDADSITRLLSTLDGRTIDALINNAGIMHRSERAGEVDDEAWMETFAVNTLAPFRLTTRLHANLQASARPRVMTVSSQMGSIERGGTGSIAYRSSKAAVNRAMRSLAEEWKGDGITVVVVHPGWVRTDLGGGEADLSPRDSGTDLARLVEGLSPSDSGRFLNHDGTAMPW